METERHTGTVKFYNVKNRFGFVVVDGTGAEIYFNDSALKDGLVDAGEPIEFTIGTAKRGPVALDIRKVKAGS
jgi:cold shock CspA family protein